MKSLTRWFVQGLIVLLPLTATLGVVTYVFNWLDDLFHVGAAIGPKGGIPGLGFVFAVVTITTVGWLASLFLGRWLVRITDWLIGRIPLVSSIYGTIKDILVAIGGDKKTFEHPVVVTLTPGSTYKLLGFVTRHDLAEIGLPGEVFAAGFTTSLAPTTRTRSVLAKSSLIWSRSNNWSYGTFASASRTFM